MSDCKQLARGFDRWDAGAWRMVWKLRTYRTYAHNNTFKLPINRSDVVFEKKNTLESCDHHIIRRARSQFHLPGPTFTKYIVTLSHYIRRIKAQNWPIWISSLWAHWASVSLNTLGRLPPSVWLSGSLGTSVHKAIMQTNIPITLSRCEIQRRKGRNSLRTEVASLLYQILTRVYRL